MTQYCAIRMQKMINGHMAYVDVPPHIHAHFGDSIDYFRGEHLQYFDENDSIRGTAYPPESDHFTIPKFEITNELKYKEGMESEREKYKYFQNLVGKKQSYRNFFESEIYKQSFYNNIKNVTDVKCKLNNISIEPLKQQSVMLEFCANITSENNDSDTDAGNKTE